MVIVNKLYDQKIMVINGFEWIEMVMVMVMITKDDFITLNCIDWL